MSESHLNFYEMPDFISYFANLIQNSEVPDIDRVIQTSELLKSFNSSNENPLLIRFKEIKKAPLVKDKKPKQLNGNSSISSTVSSKPTVKSSKPITPPVPSPASVTKISPDPPHVSESSFIFKIDSEQKEIIKNSKRSYSDHYDYSDFPLVTKKLRSKKDSYGSQVIGLINEAIFVFISNVMESYKASSYYIFQYFLFSLSVGFFIFFFSFNHKSLSFYL